MTNEEALAAFADSMGTPKDSVMMTLNEAVERYLKLRSEVGELSEEVNQRVEAIKRILEREIPDIMDQVGIAEFSTRDGAKVKVEETIRANISKARTEEAFRWLRANGADALIENVIQVQLPKGTVNEQRDSIMGLLSAIPFPVVENAKVHPSTLSAFVREKIKQGVDLPHELLGIFRQRTAKINAVNHGKGDL